MAALLLCLVLGAQAMMNQPTQEDQAKIKALGQLGSAKVFNLTLDNYKEMFNGSDWAVLFCQGSHQKCNLLNVPWVKIAEQSKKRDVVMARALVEKNEQLFRKMGIRDVPSVLYVSEGYIYNYTGLLEWRAVEELVHNQTYLQYDRSAVQPSAFKQFSRSVDQVFKLQPALYWSAEVLTVLLLAALLGRRAAPKLKEE